MTSLKERLKTLETQMMGTLDPALVFLDDEPTFKLTGFTICTVTGGIDIARKPGESIEALQERCQAEDKSLRVEGIGTDTAGTIFLPIYDFAERRTA